MQGSTTSDCGLESQNTGRRLQCPHFQELCSQKDLADYYNFTAKWVAASISYYGKTEFDEATEEDPENSMYRS